jgi:hypothetical protein
MVAHEKHMMERALEIEDVALDRQVVCVLRMSNTKGDSILSQAPRHEQLLLLLLLLVVVCSERAGWWW